MSGHLGGYLILLLFVAAVWLTVATCNSIDHDAQVAIASEQLVQFIKPAFPWISAFQHISVGPPAYEHQFLKIETIMSLWFVFGLSASALIILKMLTMTP